MTTNAKIEFNEDELEPPKWLNIEFFTNVLQHSEKDKNIQVKNIKLSPGTAKGDHYASVMFRAKLDYTQNGKKKEKSVICKTMPDNDCNKQDLLNDSKIFETEIGMYSEMIPMMEKYLRNIGDNTKLSANCIYYSLSPRKLMIFEDLVTLGYEVIRGRELNEDEVKAAYLKLAKWHAISYKIVLENPSILGNYRYGIFTMKQWIENDFITTGIDNFVESIETAPNLLKYKPFFIELKKDLIQKCIDSFTEYNKKPVSGTNYVLCHGDFHMKNMMFKLTPHTQKLEDVMLLDFQLSYVGPIVNDLIYSRYMLLSVDMRIDRFDEYLHYYFTNFIDILDKIGFKGNKPKLLDLKQQLVQHRHFELFLLVTFLPMWYSFREGEIDPDQMIESNNYRRKLYDNKEFIAELHKLLPYYLHNGYLECGTT